MRKLGVGLAGGKREVFVEHTDKEKMIETLEYVSNKRKRVYRIFFYFYFLLLRRTLYPK